jgi:acyl-CoA dehydrogenase
VDSPWIDDELRAWRDHVARFLQREFLPHADRWERERAIDRTAWHKAGEAGLLCAGIPEEHGGGGGSYAHEAVVAQEIAHVGLAGSFGAGNAVSSAIVARYILAYGTEAQKNRWLHRMAAGELIGAIAMTEPGAGSDLQSIKTNARKVAGGYRISGQKTFITNGHSADLVLVVAKTDTTDGAKGVSLLAIEAQQAEGLRRGRRLEKLGMHAQDTSELFFDDVFVPTDNLLGGEEGAGFTQLMQQLAWERLIIALDAVVAMERAVQMTTEYVKQRKAFGQPLLALQNTQFKLAECKTKATVGRVFVDQLMMRLLGGTLDPGVAAMAKLWTTETQGQVVDECLQLHGGYGYMTEYPIARLYADSRASRIYGGTNEIMKLIIARTL